MPIIAAKDGLIEDSADTAQETLFPALKAHVIGLALSLHIGVHSRLIRNTTTCETGFRYYGIPGKVNTRRSHYTAIYRRLGVGLAISAIHLSLVFLGLRTRWWART